ncbi:MAG TPA: hypothetical protein VGF73_04240 [Chthoniobacterales bacterium]
MMRKFIRLIAWPILGLTTAALAKDDLPKTEPFAHYEPMVKRSPFAVATAGAPVGGKPDFAKDLYVANAAHSPEGDFVTIASLTDKNLKEYLNTKETIDGYSVSSIQWSDRVGETKVTISKDGQFATLTFNEALLSQAIHNPVPPVSQPQQIPGRLPIMGRPPGSIQRPMPVPQVPTPPPHVRGTIRRRNTALHNLPPQQRAVQRLPQDDDSDLVRP